jgi:hypothetical protein
VRRRGSGVHTHRPSPLGGKTAANGQEGRRRSADVLAAMRARAKEGVEETMKFRILRWFDPIVRCDELGIDVK